MSEPITVLPPGSCSLTHQRAVSVTEDENIASHVVYPSLWNQKLRRVTKATGNHMLLLTDTLNK